MGRCGAPRPHVRACKSRVRMALVACGLALLSGAAAPELPAAQIIPDAASRGLVVLGEYLFQSPLLSADGSVSCRTCHVPSLGFSGDRPLAVGVAGHVS